jgi:hypothetical protein
MDSSGHSRSARGGVIRPVRLGDPKMLRRLALMIVIVGLVLGALYLFKTWRDGFLKHVFAQKPPPVAVAMTRAQTQTVPHFLAAIRSNPKYASAHSNLGVTLKQLGRFGEAEGRGEQDASALDDRVRKVDKVPLDLHPRGMISRRVGALGYHHVRLAEGPRGGVEELGVPAVDVPRVEEPLPSRKVFCRKTGK